jgi:putative transcriptional regulator
MARKTLAALKANPPKLSAEHRARIEAMTDDQLDQNAKDDIDNPPMTDEQLDRAVFARTVRQLRQKLDLTQDTFAKRFHISLSRLKDWEQARYRPDSVAAAYLKVIERDPKAVERALETED